MGPGSAAGEPVEGSLRSLELRDAGRVRARGLLTPITERPEGGARVLAGISLIREVADSFFYINMCAVFRAGVIES
jgi:hypothetical protein